MNKRELKNGMYFKTRNNNWYDIIRGEVFKKAYEEQSLKYKDTLKVFISRYDEELKSNHSDRFDIMEVYDSDGELIWKRDEVDWSKVKFGTKVIVWNNLHEDSKVEGLFLSLSPTAREPRFLVYYETNDCYGNPIGHANIFDKCKLIEEPKGEVTLDELILEHDELHKSCDRNCMSCKYNDWDANCMLLWILDNYEIIRKQEG